MNSGTIKPISTKTIIWLAAYMKASHVDGTSKPKAGASVLGIPKSEQKIDNPSGGEAKM